MKKIIGVHNYVRDKIWAFATKPPASAERMFDYLPLTDKTKAIHWIDGQWAEFRNRMQKIERWLLASAFWLLIALIAMHFIYLAFHSI